jgi:hypothetical protein
LTAGSVSRAEAPERIGRGLAAHPVGVVVMGRLAVDSRARAKVSARPCCRMHSCGPSTLPIR